MATQESSETPGPRSADAITIIEGLESTRRSIWHVDAIAGILLQAEDAGGGFEDGIIGTNMQAIRDALSPACQALERAIDRLGGDPHDDRPKVIHEPEMRKIVEANIAAEREADDREPTADAVGREYYAHRDREKSGNISGGSPYDDLLLRLERVDSILVAINDAEMSGQARDLVNLAAIARSEIVAAECVCEANSKRWDSAA